MILYRFDAAVGKEIGAYESVGLTMSRIVRGEGPFHLGCMHVAPGGVVGGHAAPVAQLFLVVARSGSVRADGSAEKPGSPVDVEPGTAVFWEPGEWHETAAGEQGLTAFVLECPNGIEPGASMPEVSL